MKNVLVVSLALGMAVTLIPSTFADSFGYRTIGSNSVTKFTVDINRAGLGSGVSAAAAFSVHGGAQLRAHNSVRRVNASYSANAFTQSRSASDNFFSNQAAAPKGLLDRSGALVDLSGSEVNLLLGAFNGGESKSAPAAGGFNFGDKGPSRVNDGLSRATSELAAGAATLAATPEPGSLFLLGTGLLCMALVLFRKGGKRPSES